MTLLPPYSGSGRGTWPESGSTPEEPGCGSVPCTSWGTARCAWPEPPGSGERTIRDLVSGDARTVSVRLRDIVIAVYDTWWDKRAPERNRAETTAARMARRRAIAGNWCAAAALDDDLLDTPGYKPQYGWRPARGTGVAADLHPPQHSRPRRRP